MTLPDSPATVIRSGDANQLRGSMLNVQATTDHSHISDREVSCPRCGYDQRGVIDTWKQACPLDGVCSECGLTLDWHELFQPERYLPVWCVEHTVRRRRFPLAALATLLRSCWPWMFWKQLKMAHVIRPWRIGAYLLLLISPLLLIYIAAQTTVALLVRQQMIAQLNQNQQTAPATLRQLQATQPFRLYFPETALPSLAVAGEQRLEWNRQRIIAQMQITIQNPPYIDFSPMQAVFEAIFMPTAKQSRGRFVAFLLDPEQGALPPDPTKIVETSWPYPPPSDWWRIHLDATTSPLAMIGAGGGGGGRRLGRNVGLMSELQPTLGALGFWLVVLAIGLPLSLVLLPVSLRRAKVRWAHIGRVFLYSLALPLLLLQATVAVWLTAAIGWPAERIDDEMWMLPTMFALPVMLMCWWWAAIKHYLRLPHALAVVVVHAVLCVLVAVAVMFWGFQLLAH